MAEQGRIQQGPT